MSKSPGSGSRRLAIGLLLLGVFVFGALQFRSLQRRQAVQSLQEDYSAEVIEHPRGLKLRFSGDQLKDFEEVGSLASLAGRIIGIDVSLCTELRSFEGLGRHRHLEIVSGLENPLLEDLSALEGQPGLHTLSLLACPKLSDTTPIGRIPKLRVLDLSHCVSVTTISGLQPSLEDLFLSGCLSLEALDLRGTARLRQLFADGCPKLTVIQGLESQTSLTDLDLSACPSLETLPSLQSLGALAMLNLRSTPIRSLDETLGNLTGLQVLRLGGDASPGNLSFLEGMKQLRECHLEAAVGLTSLETLPHVPSLRYLGLDYAPDLTSLDGIGAASGLIELSSVDSPQLESIAGLQELKALERLDLSRCRRLSDASPLHGLTGLDIVSVGGTAISNADLRQLQKQLPETIIDRAEAPPEAMPPTP